MSPISKKPLNYLILVLLRCSILDNGRENPSVLHPKTDQSNITFTGKDIGEVIQHLDSNKAQGHDMIDIHVLKICVQSIIKPLLILYQLSGAIRGSSRGKSIHHGDTTLEKIYNYSRKCATPSRKIRGWFPSIELFKKVKNTESTIVGLQERSRQEIFKHFHSYDNCTLSENFRPRNCPS